LGEGATSVASSTDDGGSTSGRGSSSSSQRSSSTNGSGRSPGGDRHGSSSSSARNSTNKRGSTISHDNNLRPLLLLGAIDLICSEFFRNKILKDEFVTVTIPLLLLPT